MKHPATVALAAALIALSLPLVACTPTSDDPATESYDGETVTIPPITIPTEPDDRVLTDLSPYAERLDALFAGSNPAPAADFTYEIADEGVTVTGYTGGEIVVVIPDTIESLPVTAIASDAFAGKGSIKAISVPDTVTSIGVGAFRGCTALTSLRTPVYTCEDAPYFGALFGATSYESGASAVPNKLSTLVLTDGVVIPEYAFYACRSLEVISLPKTMSELGDFAFYGCRSLAYIATADIPLTALGEHVFAGCESLPALHLPQTVTEMGPAILEGCGKLESLTVPFVGGGGEDNSYIGYLFGASDYVFTAGYIPASLIEITVHDGCPKIADNAFYECASVRSVTLPEGATAIGRRAFYGCENLATVTLPDGIFSIGDEAFYGCLRLTSVEVSKGLCELGVQAFMNCVSLESVSLPVGVSHLPNSCFAGCLSLVRVTAAGPVTLGEQVFRGCDRLTEHP